MTEQELHPVVQLLLGRMKSHPEEFEAQGYGRWHYALDLVRDHGSEEELEAIQTAMRGVRLEEAHVWVLDELCNGEERRKEEGRKRAQLEHVYRSAQVASQIPTTLAGAMAQNVYPNNSTNQTTLASLLGGAKNK
jgi:hypothetical protein